MPHRDAADHDVVRVAEACGDAARAELVVVAVPHRLACVRVGDPSAWHEREHEQREPEEQLV